MDILSDMIASNKIPHALFFVGTKEAQIEQKARQFAIALLGRYPHPDLHEYFPHGKANMHSIETLRNLAYEVGFVPYEAKWKVFIIYEADKMLLTSSSALLKIFEEPAKSTVIIIVSYYPEKILPTILSRCRRIDFIAPHKTSRHKILDVLAQKEPLESIEEGKELEELFEAVLNWYRDRLLLNIKGGERYLTYPDYHKHIQSASLFPIDYVEKALQEARMGLERSIKLLTCLEVLFYKLQIY
ncbi:MAG: hypothetical protein R3E91_00525 [Chlamydiales bacterium]